MTKPPLVHTSIVVKSIDPKTSQWAFKNDFHVLCRLRFDAVGSEDVSHRRVGDLVTKIGQSSLDSVIAPRGILRGHLKDKLRHFF